MITKDDIELYIGIGSVIAGFLYSLRKIVQFKKIDVEKLKDKCTMLMNALGCNRVFIMKYHNGHWYSGDHRQKMSMVVECFDRENPIRDYYTDVVITANVHRIMLDFQEKNCSYFETFSHIHEEEVKKRAKLFNINAMYTFPVFHSKGKTRYTISFTWKTVHSLEENDKQFILKEIELIKKIVH